MNRYFTSTIKQPKHYLVILCMLLSSAAFNQAQAATIRLRIEVIQNPNWAVSVNPSNVTGTIFVYDTTADLTPVDLSNPSAPISTIATNAGINKKQVQFVNFARAPNINSNPDGSSFNCGVSATLIPTNQTFLTVCQKDIVVQNPSTFAILFTSAGMDSEFVGFTIPQGISSYCQKGTCELFVDSNYTSTNPLVVTAKFKSTNLLARRGICDPRYPIPTPQNCISVTVPSNGIVRNPSGSNTLDAIGLNY